MIDFFIEVLIVEELESQGFHRGFLKGSSYKISKRHVSSQNVESRVLVARCRVRFENLIVQRSRIAGSSYPLEVLVEVFIEVSL